MPLFVNVRRPVHKALVFLNKAQAQVDVLFILKGFSSAVLALLCLGTKYGMELEGC